MTFHPAPIKGDQGEAGSPDTPEQVRTKIADAADSNVYTDAEKAAVATIEDKITDADLQEAIGAIELPDGDPPFVLDFESSAAGWDGELFPANQTIDSVGGNLVITKTADGPHASADSRNISGQGFDWADTEYQVTINVVSMSGEWLFLSTYSNPATNESLSVGENVITFTRDSTGTTQFPTIVKINATDGDTIEISSIEIGGTDTAPSIRQVIDEQVSTAIQTVGKSTIGLGNVENIAPENLPVSTPTAAAIASAIAALDLPDPPFVLDFETSAAGWDGTLFGANQTIQIVNGSLVVTKDSDSSASIDARNIQVAGLTDGFVDGKTYRLIVEISQVVGAWDFVDTFSQTTTTAPLSAGTNTFTFVRDTSKNTQHPAIVNRSSSGTTGQTITIDSISIAIVDETEQTESGYDPDTEYIWLGGITHVPNGVTPDNEKGVIIGNGAIGTADHPTVVGNLAKVEHTTYYGSNQNLHGAAFVGELEAAVFGYRATGGGWRTTAFGAHAYALGQSSTALGTGAVTLAAHGQALGRGAFVPDEGQIRGVGTVLAARSLFLTNTWGHKFSTPYSGIGVSHDLAVPSNIVTEFHGADAFDGRYPEWDAATVFPEATSTFTGRIVQHNGKAYKSIDESGPGTPKGSVEPGVSPDTETTWVYMHDVVTLAQNPNDPNAGPPSDFNVDGGHARVISGRATGSGTGGTAGFSVPNGVNIGQNQKQTVREAFYVDSDSGNANTNLCFESVDGTQYRMNMESDGTLKAIQRNSLSLTYPCNQRHN